MAMTDGDRRADLAATGPEAVAAAFANQAAYCRANGAAVTGSVCAALLELIHTDRGGTVMLRVRKWAGPALADALPLRVAGGLHALYLAGEEPELAPIYEGLAPTNAAERIGIALERHEPFLLPWLDGPPQTNEAARSWAFAAAMLWLADDVEGRGLPADFVLHEIGSSAGINLMMRRYRYDLGGVMAGPEGAQMRFAPEWRGEPPPDTGYDIVGAKGCDVAPVDLTDPAQALRLRGYVWPEATARFARLDAAIAAAHTMPPEVARQRAGDFVAEMLAEPARSGVTRVLMHSVVWQYVAQSERDAIARAMEEAGTKATSDAPLAWIKLEADRDANRHDLSVRYWPGGADWQMLAHAHPHGEWVEWLG